MIQCRWPIAASFQAVVLLAGSSILADCADAQPLSIATDPFTQLTCAASAATNHQAIVEPDSFSYGSTIVMTYQVGRIYDGGACAIGFATSTDNGATWRSGLLPGITKYASSGAYDRATDPAVAYDAKHNAWMISTLALSESGGVIGKAVLTSRSTDGGLTWGNPVVTETSSIDADKNWIVCDDSNASLFYGNCYTQWDDYGAGNKLYMSTSSDGGLTWGAAKTNNTGVIGGQPVVRPDGIVVVPIANANETAIGSFYSQNGGASWSPATTITKIKHHTVAGNLREGPLPSAEIDGAGNVYVAWADCRFRRACKTNDIVFTKSRNSTGTLWSAIARIPIDATNSGVDHFIPGLAVNKATSGGAAQVGLTYYYYKANSSNLNVGFVSSLNGGTTWSVASTLTTTAAPTTWAAETSQGRMVGDYISTSFGSDNLAHGAFVVADTPASGQATACTTTSLDNCKEFMATTATGLAPGSLVAAAGPILFAGDSGAGAQSLWNIVANNGNKHRN